MSITPMPAPRPEGRVPRARPGFEAGGSGLARSVRPGRRWPIGLAKRVLPVVALGLLAVVALYPELNGSNERSRISYRRVEITPEGGQLSDARYQGLDDQGRPFTVTAIKVRQIGPDRTDLEQPKADMEMQTGAWIMVAAQRGVYEQRANRLDLSGEVTLYRDDGTMLQTESVSIDMRESAAASHEMVHAEGPFGVLDAQGFTVTDRGTVIRFFGPSRLVLNGGSK